MHLPPEWTESGSQLLGMTQVPGHPHLQDGIHSSAIERASITHAGCNQLGHPALGKQVWVYWQWLDSLRLLVKMESGVKSKDLYTKFSVLASKIMKISEGCTIELTHQVPQHQGAEWVAVSPLHRSAAIPERAKWPLLTVSSHMPSLKIRWKPQCRYLLVKTHSHAEHIRKWT